MAKWAVVCVLKRGGVYNPEWVYRLQKMIKPHLPPDTDFVCLTDDNLWDVSFIPMADKFPGFWSKIGLFKPNFLHYYEKLLYLDLDVIVTSDLTPFFETTDEFQIAFVEPYNEKNPKRCIGYQSSVMCWTPGKRDWFYDQFTSGDMGIFYGDQDYLKTISPNEKTFPKEWVTKLEPPDFNPGEKTKISLCIRPKNNEMVKSYKWIRDIWGPPLD